MKNALNKIEFPELFFGIVSPVGVDVTPTISCLSDYLKGNQYEVFVIKITDYFEYLNEYLGLRLPLVRGATEDRLNTFIDFGNAVRSLFNDDSVLASYAIFQIMRVRNKQIKKTDNISYQKRAFIIQQFKRSEEVDLFRSVYGDLFFQVSVYSKKESRLNYLSHKMAHEKNTADQSLSRPTAYELIAKDENERSNVHGQRVGKVFHDADFVVNCDVTDRKAIRDQIDRFCELLFSSNEVSPTKQEYGMFAAKAAALRTLDLSRQVGAAVFNSSGEIISMGSNEVPKARGGTYWCDEQFDAREYTKRNDSNDERKREILHEIFLASESPLTFEAFAAKESTRDSQFMDALEYGRIVHAEMSAITDAARLGISTRGAVLYCTTFPCHMCAKHIVSSGIESVVFLEPYPKSLASDLHPDSIEIEGGPRMNYGEYPSVNFEHFFGITPRRYRQLFERGSRKRDGKYLPYINGVKRPNISLLSPSYIELERRVVEEGIDAAEELALARRKREKP